MKIEFIDGSMYGPVVVDSHNTSSPYIDDYNSLNFFMPSTDATLFVDPSSTCTGIVLCDNPTQTPVLFANLYRSTTNSVKQEGTELIDECVEFIHALFKKHASSIKYAIVERAYDGTDNGGAKKYNPYQKKKLSIYNTALLISAHDRMSSAIKRYRTMTFCNSPSSWEHCIFNMYPDFAPQEFKREYIKPAVTALAIKCAPVLKFFKKKDCCDAFGMGLRFYTEYYPYLSQGVIPVMPDMIRTFNTSIVLDVRKADNMEECQKAIQEYITYAKIGRFKKEDARDYKFLLNESLSLKENIKALQYLDPYNVFWTIHPITSKILPMITEFRDDLGELSPNDKLFICGRVVN